MYIQIINSEVNDMTFNEVKNILVEIQNDKALQMQAMRECEKLYAEVFAIDDPFTGCDVIESLKNESEFNRNSTIDSYLYDVFAYEKNMEKAILASKESGKHAYSEYLNILNSKNKKMQEYNDLAMEMVHEDNINDLYMLDDYFEDDYPEDEFLSNKDHLLEIFKSTKFVYLCNYKGEIESVDLLINSITLRKFHGKYDYS